MCRASAPTAGAVPESAVNAPAESTEYWLMVAAVVLITYANAPSGVTTGYFVPVPAAMVVVVPSEPSTAIGYLPTVADPALATSNCGATCTRPDTATASVLPAALVAVTFRRMRFHASPATGV